MLGGPLVGTEVILHRIRSGSIAALQTCILHLLGHSVHFGEKLQVAAARRIICSAWRRLLPTQMKSASKCAVAVHGDRRHQMLRFRLAFEHLDRLRVGVVAGNHRLFVAALRVEPLSTALLGTGVVSWVDFGEFFLLLGCQSQLEERVEHLAHFGADLVKQTAPRRP